MAKRELAWGLTTTMGLLLWPALAAAQDPTLAPDTGTPPPASETPSETPPAPPEPPPAAEPPPEPPPSEPAPAATQSASIDLQPREPADEPAPGALGKGTIEVRVQTATNVGSLTGLNISVPGVFYNPDSEAFVLNLIGGLGYFVSPSLAVGGDLGILYADSGPDEGSIIMLAPFLKFVTGLPEQKTGFFAELSPGLAFAGNNELAEATVLQLSAWAGGHFPLGRRVAFLVGPSLLRADDVENFGDGFFVLGARFGISAYL